MSTIYTDCGPFGIDVDYRNQVVAIEAGVTFTSAGAVPSEERDAAMLRFQDLPSLIRELQAIIDAIQRAKDND